MSEQRLALVTGASRGIGRAVAENLGQAGHIVVGTATSQSGADAISSYFAEQKIEGKGMVVNVSDSEAIEQLIKDIKAEFSKTPEILVNNAGITRDNLLMRMGEEDFDKVIEVNLKSVFNMTKAVQRTMLKQRKGSIINMSSVVGVKGNAGQTNYAASKAGIIGFSKSVALELGSRNIRSNVIAPGFIETEMTDKLDEKTVQGWRDAIPLKRGGSPEDVANACLFLASDLSDYITGQVLNVDGGMLT